ncbi:MAG: phytanoyl-CoA dioxygenase family protein [Proteobacteria bacterium]|nr:phytanoyl-CoA dioxygenase family protein [Pseudomonadota bacterium]MDA1355872.1 phytanoyl-CoA dioxygenase family protein [Pseudomonadota bacterium]
MAGLTRVASAETSAAAICDILNRDGAVVVEGATEPGMLAALNADLDHFSSDIGVGLRHPTNDFFADFYGASTVRFDGLPAKSAAFLDVMQLPLLQEVADILLKPSCEDYLLNTAQLIEIRPGETVQLIHRDEDAWAFMPKVKPLLQVEAMFALSDFTKASGATHVVPGSHLWEPDREPEPAEILQAEMPAGSALFYLGRTLHGGGANVTADVRRRGMFLGFVVGWLRTEENMFLTVPMEAAKTMPVRVQELLGYKAHAGIGVVDVGSPMALLQ